MGEFKKPLFVWDEDDGNIFSDLKPISSNIAAPKLVEDWKLFKKLNSIKVSLEHKAR